MVLNPNSMPSSIFVHFGLRLFIKILYRVSNKGKCRAENTNKNNNQKNNLKTIKIIDPNSLQGVKWGRMSSSRKGDSSLFRSLQEGPGKKVTLLIVHGNLSHLIKDVPLNLAWEDFFTSYERFGFGVSKGRRRK